MAKNTSGTRGCGCRDQRPARRRVTFSEPVREPARESAARQGCIQNPYYTGPGAPGSVYDSPDYPMPCGSGVCYDRTAYSNPNAATFLAYAPLSVPEGGGVPLRSTGLATDPFAVEDGNIAIPYAGAYFAIWTAHIPPCPRLDTALSLRLNGEELPASRAIVKGPGTCVGQTVFIAGSGDVLSLTASDALEIPGAPEGQPLFTLSLFQIG